MEQLGGRAIAFFPLYIKIDRWTDRQILYYSYIPAQKQKKNVWQVKTTVKASNDKTGAIDVTFFTNSKTNLTMLYCTNSYIVQLSCIA